MSDSDDDFASADEGEVSHSAPKQPDATQGKDRKEIQGLGTDEASTKSKRNERSDQEKLEYAVNAAKNDHDKESTSKIVVKDIITSSSAPGKKSGNQKKSKQKGKKKASSPSETTDVQKKSSDTTGIVNTEVDADASENSSLSSEISKDNVVKDISAKSERSNTKTAGGDDSKQQGVITNKEEIEEADDKEQNHTPKRPEEVVNEKTEPDSADLIKSPSTQSITRPGQDHTEERENVLKKLAEAGTEKKQSGWGWGWGSSLLNVASSSVSTFTSQVGEGFNTMIETVESTLNVPSPEDLVAEKKKQEEEEDEEEEEKVPEVEDSVQGELYSGDAKPEKTNISQDNDKSESTETLKAESQTPQESSNSWFSSWGVGNITKMVESTGKTLVTGSLDVLETLGKKTFHALNEHDPGLKKTRGLLKERGDKPNLSAVLRDARDQHEKQVKLEKESEEARKAHFGTLFDDFQGLAHLEALEILSNQSEKKVNTLLMALSPDIMAALKPQLLEIKTNFEIGEEDEEDVDEQDFCQLLSDIFGQLDIGISPDKLTRMQSRIRDIVIEFGEREDKPPAKEIHQTAIQSLAEFTAKCMEQYHKAGEMVLLHRGQNSDFVACSSQLHSLTKVLCAEVGILSTKFTECLNSNAEADDNTNINQLVTSVYLEASNSSSYIQDGFQLLLPVMQQAAIEKEQEPVS